jgi:hypothetical protein
MAKKKKIPKYTWIVLGIAILVGTMILTSGGEGGVLAKFAIPAMKTTSNITATPFALNAWINPGGKWAPCDQFDGGQTWANSYCATKGFAGLAYSCYYEWASQRWKPVNITQKGVSTGAGGAMTKVMCKPSVSMTTDTFGFRVNEGTIFAGHNITLVNVGSASNTVVISVDGVQETVVNCEDVGVVTICIKDTAYDDVKSLRYAIFSATV